VRHVRHDADIQRWVLVAKDLQDRLVVLAHAADQEQGGGLAILFLPSPRPAKSQLFTQLRKRGQQDGQSLFLPRFTDERNDRRSSEV
jgi:hypothetical protein